VGVSRARRAAVVLVFIGLAFAGAFAAGATTPTITLHAGQSKRLGVYTVVCTTRHLAPKPKRVVLHPGHSAKVHGVRVRCVAGKKTITIPMFTIGTLPAPAPYPT
jgi:type IV secretory pathway protease TraF